MCILDAFMYIYTCLYRYLPGLSRFFFFDFFHIATLQGSCIVILERMTKEYKIMKMKVQYVLLSISISPRHSPAPAINCTKCTSAFTVRAVLEMTVVVTDGNGSWSMYSLRVII